MPIYEKINDVAKYYTNNIAKDHLFLEQIVNREFGTNYKFIEQDWAHLYASLVSNKNVCLTYKPGQCEMATETGHNRSKGLITYYRTLVEIAIKAYKSPNSTNTNYLSSIKEELKHVYNTIILLLHRQENSIEAHTDHVFNKLQRLPNGETLRYHAGYIGHSLYINFMPLGNSFRAKISNLGNGIIPHHARTPLTNNQELIHLRSVNINSLTYLKSYLKEIATYSQQSNSDLALNAIYPTFPKAQEEYDRAMNLAEIPQGTGNCVIKNMLFAMRDTINNEECYQFIYKSLVDTSLSNRSFFSHLNELPAPSDVCQSVLTSQLSFLLNAGGGDCCSNVVDNMRICNNNDTYYDIYTILTYVLVGAVLGAMVGYCYSDEKNRKMAMSIGMLVGVIGGSYAGSFFAVKKPRENSCKPLPETGQHYNYRK